MAPQILKSDNGHLELNIMSCMPFIGLPMADYAYAYQALGVCGIRFEIYKLNLSIMKVKMLKMFYSLKITF